MRNRSLPEHLILFSTIINCVDVYFHKEVMVMLEANTTFSLYNAFFDNKKTLPLIHHTILLLRLLFYLFLIYLSTFFMFTDCSFSRCLELGEELYKLRLSFLSISSVYSKYYSSYCCKLILYTDE